MAEKKTKHFLFMYPIDEYFDFEIANNAFAYLNAKESAEKYRDLLARLNKAKTREEQIAIQQEGRRRDCALFRPAYSRILNKCINERYRQQGFQINFLLFDDTAVSDVVDFHEGDRILHAGVTFKKHTSEKVYPDQNCILEPLMPGKISHLRIGGFHVWDCVEKSARAAYERGVDVLVDEDLTEWLIARVMQDPNFRYSSYPGYHPKECFRGVGGFDGFMEPRKTKPWLLQKY